VIRKIIIVLMTLMVAIIGVIFIRALIITLPIPAINFTAADEISIDIDSAIKRLAGSIRIRTISHGQDTPVEKEAFQKLHEYFEQNFPAVHAELKREIINDYSLLYLWEGSNSNLKPVLLLAHMDVVPIEPGTEDQWLHPPFAGVIANGYLWGRGTLDVKQSVLGLLEAVEYLAGQGKTPERTVYLAFGHDEEIGGSNGAAKIAELLEKRGVHLEFTLDEGAIIAHDLIPGITRPVALIGLAEKGYLTLELVAKGEAGHSSRPPRPPQYSSIHKLARAIRLLESNQIPAALRSPVSEMFATLVPKMDFSKRMVMTNRWLFDPLIFSQFEKKATTNALIRTTTATTMIKGGIKENILPAQVKATVNFRILPGDSVDMVIKHVHRVINDPDITVKQVGIMREPSPVSDINGLDFSALQLTVAQMFPEVLIAPSLVLGGTDSKHYIKIADNSYRFIPMRLYPDDIKRIHGINERIGIDNYAEIIRFYIQLLRNFNLKK
jgi:carboxypeptidase PM20D1